uniref:Uncharacterized protein n=1 Tax=Rhizophora mucronata TaxID=61149 RepID=A0A2P2QY73_RHIMU
MAGKNKQKWKYRTACLLRSC